MNAVECCHLDVPIESTMKNWTVDLAKRKVRHSSGLVIAFEGKPDSHHFTGSPGNYPKELPPFELSRLIREGFESYQAAWNTRFTSTTAGQYAGHALTPEHGYLSKPGTA